MLDIAVDTLIVLGRHDAGPLLFELAEHRRPEVRLKAVQALAALQPRGADRALIDALADENPAVRSAAASALGEIGAQSAMDALFHSLDRQNGEAASAIGRIAGPADVDRFLGYLGQLPFSLITPALDEMLHRQNLAESARMSIVHHLSELATPEVRAFLEQVVSTLPSSPVRSAAEDAIPRILAMTPHRSTSRHPSTPRHRFTLALAFTLAAGCGGASIGLSPTFPDNQPAALGDVVSRVQADDAHPRPMAVGLSGDHLYAYDLSAGRMLWNVPVEDPRTAPSIAGDLVVLHEGNRVVARRLTDGGAAFTVADQDFRLAGAAGEGPLAAIVLSTGGGVGARSRVLIVRGGGIDSAIELDSAAGVPAVRGGLVFLPWGNQNVSVIDPATGREAARLRFMEGVVGHARATDAGVFFGQQGVGRVAAEVPQGVGWFQPDVQALPGQPPLWRDAYAPPAGPRSAEHRIRLVWTPQPGEGAVQATDGTLYMSFYRLVFGLAQDDLTPRFVYEHPADIVGATAREGGVLLADADGGLTYLDAQGRPRWSAETGQHPSVVALRIGGFTPPDEAPAAALPPLADQLLGAAMNTDTRLVPGRAYAVRLLAAQPAEGVTERLIVLCDDASLPAELHGAACDALSTRDVGSDAVLAALERHASFLTGTHAPPVGALAMAAAQQNERRAVPLLLAQLRDPETPDAALVPLADALARLGDDSAMEPLSDFLWLYHADSNDETLAQGLGAVGRALIALGGPSGREEVQRVSDAPFTTPEVRAQLTAALQAEQGDEGSEESGDAQGDGGDEG